MDRVVEILQGLSAIHSPSGMTGEVIAHCAAVCKKAGIAARVTNKGGLLAGNHPAPDLVATAHVDTLGAMVRGVNGDGQLAFTAIGGPVWPSFEGEYVTVVTTEGKKHRGTLLLNNPSAHVNREAGKAERTPDAMYIRLDAPVKKKEDTAKLGIQVGDFIVFDPRFEHTATGFVKSRFLDDKAGAACLLEAMLRLGAARLRKLPLCCFFSNFEEVGHGATAGFPDRCRRMLVVDMGVVGEKVEGDEQAVSICVKDSTGPYDYGMRTRLQRLAAKGRLPYKLDVFPFYGSDGSAALA
ncbi:MAG TPA: glucanase, partial [Candidatus Edwardsbacteria bacterium]|nr:glucanase [Candidatus Edwardsbacteria bacterium]